MRDEGSVWDAGCFADGPATTHLHQDPVVPPAPCSVVSAIRGAVSPRRHRKRSNGWSVDCLTLPLTSDWSNRNLLPSEFDGTHASASTRPPARHARPDHPQDADLGTRPWVHGRPLDPATHR